MPETNLQQGGASGNDNPSSGTGGSSASQTKKSFRGLFADTASKGKKEESCDAKNLLKSLKFRSYRLSKMPPNSLTAFLGKKFKTFRSYTWNGAIIKGNNFYIITIGFDQSSPLASYDWRDSSSFSIQYNGADVHFNAIDEEELDKNGSVKPRLAKNLVINNFPMALAEAPEIVKEALSEFCTFSADLEVKLIKENGIYLGKAIIAVDDFKKKLPPTKFRMPMTYYEDGKYKKEEGCFTEVYLKPLGFDRTAEFEKPEEQVKTCFYCKKEGHIKWQCEEWKKKQEKFKNSKRGKKRGPRCAVCKQSDLACTKEKCLRQEDIDKGIFDFRRKEVEERSTNFMTFGESRSRAERNSFKRKQPGSSNTAGTKRLNFDLGPPLPVKTSNPFDVLQVQSAGLGISTPKKSSTSTRNLITANVAPNAPYRQPSRDGYNENRLQNNNYINLKNSQTSQVEIHDETLMNDSNVVVPESQDNQNENTMIENPNAGGNIQQSSGK